MINEVLPSAILAAELTVVQELNKNEEANPEQVQDVAVEPPAAPHPVMKLVGGVIMGGIGGYLCYWLVRGVEKLGLMVGVGNQVIQPMPYILSGMAVSGITELAEIIYNLSLKILGDRAAHENLEINDETPRLARFRSHSWKVIANLESVQFGCDRIYSGIFNIRTEKELREAAVADRDLRLMEVARRAFFDQFHETITTAVPQELGVYLVEALGYTVTGGHLFWLHGTLFLVQLSTKIANHYNKVQDEAIALQRQEAAAAAAAKAAEEKAALEKEFTEKFGEKPLEESVDERAELRKALRGAIEAADQLKQQQGVNVKELAGIVEELLDKHCAPVEEYIKDALKIRCQRVVESRNKLSDKILMIHKIILEFAVELNSVDLVNLEKLKETVEEADLVKRIESEIALDQQEKEFYANQVLN